MYHSCSQLWEACSLRKVKNHVVCGTAACKIYRNGINKRSYSLYLLTYTTTSCHVCDGTIHCLFGTFWPQDPGTTLLCHSVCLEDDISRVNCVALFWSPQFRGMLCGNSVDEFLRRHFPHQHSHLNNQSTSDIRLSCRIYNQLSITWAHFTQLQKLQASWCILLYTDN